MYIQLIYFLNDKCFFLVFFLNQSSFGELPFNGRKGRKTDIEDLRKKDHATDFRFVYQWPTNSKYRNNVYRSPTKGPRLMSFAVPVPVLVRVIFGQ